MNCRDCQELVQRLLDGEPVLETPAVRAHLDQCASCRADFAAARMLLAGVGNLPRVEPPVTFAARMMGEIERDRQIRRRRSMWRWYATIALAASLLLLFGFENLVSWWKQSPDHTTIVKHKDKVEPGHKQDPPDAPQLTQHAENAQKAVASLSRSVAEKTKTHLEVIWKAANPLEAAQSAVLPTLPEFEEPLDPATESLRQAGLTVAHSLEPMAQTTRQAFNFFAREMPVLDFAPRN